jgi:hypothetical protein
MLQWRIRRNDGLGCERCPSRVPASHSDRAGRPFALALSAILRPGAYQLELIHGTVASPRGERIPHAWLHDRWCRRVFDPVLLQWRHEDDYLDALGVGADARYSPAEAAAAKASGHAGPWRRLTPRNIAFR